jgi:hypothetical protein
LARPFTVIGLAGPEAFCPALDDTAYEVMRLPPFEAGAAKLIVALALPGVTFTIVGAPGTVAGLMMLEGADAGPFPIALVAVIVNV